MARKGWTALSAGYRSRLEKAGISRKDYESGQSIRKARGHENTPERHTVYDKGEFPQYHAKRLSLIDQLQEKKVRIWGDRATEERSRAVLRRYPPTIAQMKDALDMEDEVLLDAFLARPKEYSWMGYH